jgi:hypothetical protein
MPAAGGDAQQITHDGGAAPFESWDGKTVFYTKHAGMSTGPLFARPLEGGAERTILSAVNWWSYVPVEEGVYYVVQPATTAPHVFELRFQAFASGASRVLNRFEAQGVQGLTVSPDRDSILCSGMVAWNDDLMLVEGFH